MFHFLLVCVAYPVNGQWFSSPPLLNGNPNESGYASNLPSNLSIGWDDTYLYIGKKGFTAPFPTVIYFDLDPYFPVSGGSDANGNLTGLTHYNHTMSPPFRWDMSLYWEPTGGSSSYIEYRERNGIGGATIQTESAGILEDAVTSTGSGFSAECRIRWSDIEGA
ncbi:MAG: hypothetical protein ACK4IY_09960, partial [Chitinophagales bacterium]